MENLTVGQLKDIEEHKEAMLRLERRNIELHKIKDQDKSKRSEILTKLIFEEWEDPEQGHKKR